MYIRKAWYLAGFSDEIGAQLSERVMLGESVLLFRDSRGRAHAMANRCPHRFAPLSLGKLVNDRIQCGYHGIEFDTLGRCVHIPGQHEIPAGAAVRVFPVVERWSCVWIWMGDPTRADESELIQEFRFLTEPGWVPVTGVKDVAANYQLLLDNLMDLTHIAFLHQTTLGNQGSTEAATAPARTRVEGNRVSVQRLMPDCKPAPLFTQVKPDLAESIDRHQFSCFVPPCVVLIELQVMPAGTQDLARGLYWRVYHVVTPVDAHHTRCHWAVTRSFALDDAAASTALRDGTSATLHEDKVMIEAQARMMGSDSLDARTLHTRFDGTPARVRQIIEGLVRAETAPATLA